MGDVIEVPSEWWRQSRRVNSAKFQLPQLAEKVLGHIRAGRFDDADLPEDASRLIQLALYLEEEVVWRYTSQKNYDAARTRMREWPNEALLSALRDDDREVWRECPELFQALLDELVSRDIVQF